jgi:hypothetical protein
MFFALLAQLLLTMFLELVVGIYRHLVAWKPGFDDILSQSFVLAGYFGLTTVLTLRPLQQWKYGNSMDLRWK